MGTAKLWHKFANNNQLVLEETQAAPGVKFHSWKSASLGNIFICLSCVTSWSLNISLFKLSELWRAHETSRAITSCNSHVLSPITPQHGATISCDLEVTSSSWETQSIIFIKWWQLLEPQIILIFSCLSSYICNPQWLQHQYQTAQAFIFQYAVEWNASSWQPLLHGHLSAVQHC